MKRIFSSLLAGVFLLTALTGCGTAATSANAGKAAATSAKSVQLTYYYPVGVSGPLATIMTNMVNQFNQSHPDIHVNPVFSGTYPQTLAKVETSIQGGNPPDVAVLNHTAIFDLLRLDAIEPLDDVVTEGDYYPQFTEPKVQDHFWGVPFQRSTVVLYYNKDAFKKAGLDPSHGPRTWAELVSDGQALEKAGLTGIEIPSDGTTYWQFGPFATEAGQNLASNDGIHVNFNSPAAKTALNFWVDLSHKYKIEPTGILPWNTLPDDFEKGKTGMIIHSSGSLGTILKKADFSVGVSFLPKDKSQYLTSMGGGDIYLMKGLPKDRHDAALTFIKWMTAPEQQASWSMNTGYIASTPKAYDLPEMKAYVSKNPQALVAPEQLRYAQPELSTYQLNQIYDVIDAALQSALDGHATADQALDNAQASAEKILAGVQKG
ncbi:sn-glycerol-3-phosphate-binding periplasmic protein UgpB precursor [Peptococcaceae bacterium CEB3]|nr:sn-glycerol-3-phosphate-binding periplasmic protein UgpB precursor [Peptococcaceae bacterium CEB3]